MNKYLKCNKTTFLYLVTIYGAALISLIRADVMYVDDLARTADGARGWEDFGRYINNVLSPFIHGNFYLTDISPLTQILAVLIMAFASASVIYVFADGIFSFWNVIAILPMGLSPYFLQCYSFKYDSPYMALSVLASVLPLVLLKKNNIKIYAMASVIGNLVMCLTYQASSGIYPMMVVFILFQMWNQGEKIKKLIQILITSALAYVIPLVGFYLFAMKNTQGYLDNSMVAISELIRKCYEHYHQYYYNVVHQFNFSWLILSALIFVGFTLNIVENSKKKKIQAFIMTIITIACGIFMAFGVYPVLNEPTFGARSMYGIGVLISLVSLSMQINETKIKIFRMCTLLLGWLFFSFSFTYGNALSEQMRWTDYRIQMVINDLNDTDILINNENVEIQLKGNIDKSPIVEGMIIQYPILRELVPDTFGALGGWTKIYFYKYFGLQDLVVESTQNLEYMDLPLLCETPFHQIRGAGKYVLIEVY